jgi:cysteine-rich secretory family protein
MGTPPARGQEAPIAWSRWSASPVSIDATALPLVEEEALAQCGEAEARLRDIAHEVLARRLRGLPMPELDDIALMQRAAGEPHPWARAWFASGRTLDDAKAMAKLDLWLGPAARPARRRCGVASGEAADGTRALAVVTIDALADLAPLPTRVRPGQWLTIEARLRVRASGGQVIVLGPNGPPRPLPTWFDGAVLRGRFAPERPGEFALQVIADVAGGPRPVLEAIVFAGVDPPAQKDDRRAPGEDSTPGVEDDDHLARMITAARASVGLAPLARDLRLDAVAGDHAARMARLQQLAHDAGAGDPLDRLRAAGVDASCAGENVAHAPTVALAHRSLWASPSHRLNLLRKEFDRVGVGVARDPHGDAWAVETFTGCQR